MRLATFYYHSWLRWRVEFYNNNPPTAEIWAKRWNVHCQWVTMLSCNLELVSVCVCFHFSASPSSQQSDESLSLGQSSSSGFDSQRCRQTMCKCSCTVRCACWEKHACFWPRLVHSSRQRSRFIRGDYKIDSGVCWVSVGGYSPHTGNTPHGNLCP